MNINWTKQTLIDFEENIQYVEEFFGKQIALKFQNRVFDTIDIIQKNP